MITFTRTIQLTTYFKLTYLNNKMTTKNYYYRQLIDPLIYEETRQSLGLGKRKVPDHQVEAHYDQLRRSFEKDIHEHLSRENFKELCEFYPKFQTYYDVWCSGHHHELKGFNAVGRRLYAILAMYKEDHPVPQLLLREANRYMAEHEEEKQFFICIVGRYTTDREGIRAMYTEYKDWRRENFEGKIMNMREFRETLQDYLPNKP